MRRVLVLLALAATLLTGCGSVRLETTDPAPAEPGPAERQRQALAVTAERLAEVAEHALAQADGDDAEVLAAVAADARTHLQVLGGVWRPSGRYAQELAPRGDADDVLAQLTAAAAQDRAAAADADAGAAGLLVGLSLSRQLRADQLATALGEEPLVVEPALPDALDPAPAADLVRTYDALGQAWEVVAARSQAEARADAAAQAERWRASAQDLAQLAGVADSPEDPRLVAYALDDDDLAATIDDLVADLVPCWLAQVPATSGEDRLRVVQQALAAAHDAGLDPPGADLPPLPGLAAEASG